VQDEVSIGRNGSRPHQALARGRENQSDKLPNVVQRRQSEKIGKIAVKYDRIMNASALLAEREAHRQIGLRQAG
jgi:hypothetical protein